jgi:hypothetical protein
MDAMILLEGPALRHVYTVFKTVFEAGGGGLSLTQFCGAFTTAVGLAGAASAPARALTALLVDLFQQIDVNGDASLEWSEFTSYCIEAGMVRGARKRAVCGGTPRARAPTRLRRALAQAASAPRAPRPAPLAPSRPDVHKQCCSQSCR